MKQIFNRKKVTNLFICQLSESVQTEIRKSLEEHAKINGYGLEIDAETNDYLAMSGRIFDIAEIYKIEK